MRGENKMENETKYPLIIIGVALIALIAFNYNDFFTGGVVLKTSPTTYDQEKLNLIRNLDIPSDIKIGRSLNVVFSSDDEDDLIQTSKEKILIYKVEGVKSDFKKQLTYPRCTDGVASACNKAEKSFSIPTSWKPGKYVVQIEREVTEEDKAVIEVIGRAFFNIL